MSNKVADKENQIEKWCYTPLWVVMNCNKGRFFACIIQIIVITLCSKVKKILLHKIIDKPLPNFYGISSIKSCVTTIREDRRHVFFMYVIFVMGEMLVVAYAWLVWSM